jgi:methionine sulfoxide reductase heme-binding subunit
VQRVVAPLHLRQPRGVSPLVWYTARSAGIVAYLLLSTSVVLGLSMSARASFRWPRFAVEDLHRFLTIVTAVFIGIHGASLLLDRVVPISLGQVVVPFTDHYRPLAVALGIVAAELMAAVGVTNALRNRIPHLLWRRAHYATIAVWVSATAHGLLAGTDRADPWFIALVGAAVASVGLGFLGRFAKQAAPAAVGGVAVSAAVAVLALAFVPQ